MRTPKIYLETTIFNYYFDKERDAHPFTMALFDEIEAGKYLAFTSAYVLRELDKAPEDKRKKMIDLVREYGIKIIEVSREAENLAAIYVQNGIISSKFLTDATHIAAATVANLYADGGRR